MQGDIHKLGLGVLELIGNQVERDLNKQGIFDLVRPTCEQMVKDIFPKQYIDIPAALYVGWKLFEKLSSNVDTKVIDLSTELGTKNDRTR